MIHITQQQTLLPVVATYLRSNPVVVEVGAFTGHDTVRIAQQWPAGIVYAFEPVQELYQQLIVRTAAYNNVIPLCYAVSDREGEQQLYCSEKPQKPGVTTQANSLLPPKERLVCSSIRFPSSRLVSTILLSLWAQRSGISVIDFLWLDTQGYELFILQSIEHTLLPKLTALYTEVHFIESYEGAPYKDRVEQWLIQRGFMPIASDFKNQKDHFFGNMLFVNANQ